MLRRVAWSNHVQALQKIRILGSVGGPSSHGRQHSTVKTRSGQSAESTLSLSWACIPQGMAG